ncbi:unnamed protein product [Parnassius apollo]|uniref:(apollo) hypothetical protein n=1 Tax=Parnassius apollo TaxID=110799 RepID=A0A8S3W7L9_PARAO|nr:unnamed protein product [Parnassius apollo]
MESRTRRGFIISSINTYPLYFQYHKQHWPFKLPKPTSQSRQQIAAANLQHKARAAVNAAPAGGSAAGSQHFTPPAVNQADDVSPDIDEVPFSGQLQYFDNKWVEITSDKTIPSWVKGYQIPFKCTRYCTSDPYVYPKHIPRST